MILGVAMLLALAALCSAAPGTPNFRDAVLSAHGSVYATADPEFPFGGTQPMAMYFKVQWHFVRRNSVLARTFPRGFSSDVNEQGELSFLRNGGGIINREMKLVPNREYVIVFNYDGKKLSAYIDGKLAGQLDGWVPTRGTPIQFGEDSNEVFPSFDYNRVALWRRALLPGEITA